MKRFAYVFAAVTLCGTVMFAQQKPPTTAAGRSATPPQGQTRPEGAKAERAAPDNQIGQPVNMRLDLTITDDHGNGQAISKTVSIMTADRFWGRIRTQGEVTTSENRRLPVILNVDARPTLLRDNRARVELTIEYRPAIEAFTAPPAAAGSRPDANGLPPNVNESLAVVLEDGKPTLISQSADPITERKVKVEAKLTILR